MASESTTDGQWDDSRRFLHRVFLQEPEGVAETVDDVPVCPTCLRACTATKYGPVICEGCWSEHIDRSGAGGRRYVTEHGEKKHYSPLCPQIRGSQYRMTSDEECVYGRLGPCGTCGPGGQARRVMADGGQPVAETQPEPTFEVTYGCGNCGADWSEQYPPLTVVDDSDRATAYSKQCEQMGTHQCDCCNVIECPVCDLMEDVYVDDRQPIEEDDADE